MSHYILSQEAQKDWGNIVEYTLKNHGAIQVEKYTQRLETCISDLSQDKQPYKILDSIYKGLRVKHCSHHYIFALQEPKSPLLIIAIFHERMDLMTKLKGRLT